jgi:hypothetical protein
MANVKQQLETPAIPSLGFAPAAYEQRHFSENYGSLNTYFRKMIGVLGALFGPRGGKYLNIPHGAFQDNTDQIDGSPAVAYRMRYATTDYSNGISITSKTASFTATISNGGGSAGTTLNVTAVASGTIYPSMIITGTGITANTSVSEQLTGTAGGVGTYRVSISQLVSPAVTVTGNLPSQITVSQDGIYNLQYSAQFTSTDTSPADIQVWFRINNVDIQNSASTYEIPKQKNATTPSLIILTLNYFASMNDGDFIEIMWRVQSSNVWVESFPAITASGTTPAIPGTPSIIATMTFVSNLPTV